MTVPPLDIGSTLHIIGRPFGASQVPLLSTPNFLSKAREWGYRLSAEDLEDFNRSNSLIPFFVAVDEVDSMQVVVGHPDDQSLALRYARAGRLRDPSTIPAESREPHVRPNNAPEDWWDGYFYSQWQLLQLRDAVQDRENSRFVPDRIRDTIYALEARRQHLVLALLSTRYFPSVVGQIKYSDGAERSTVAEERRSFDVASVVPLSGLELDRLQGIANFLLSRAHAHDPLRQWWDLVRHSDHSGWFRLRDAALECVWQRIGAEVLLQAHEDLAEAGWLPPLPVPPPPPAAWMPLHDRIGEQPHADGLERALARLSLSPHPRVVLVLEGATEVVHLTALLKELGIANGQKVRVLEQGTSSDWPNQLAQYVAPTLGRILGGRQLVERGPTALVVAMDAEGTFWSDPASQARSTARLRSIVRREIEAQGGTLTDQELGILVQTRTWGVQKYEIANFTNEELERGLWSIAVAHGEVDAGNLLALDRLRESVAHVREQALDVGVVFRRMQWRERKPDLARLLTPVLLEKLSQVQPEEERAPVIKLAFDLYDLVARLSSGGYSLETPVERPAP